MHPEQLHLDVVVAARLLREQFPQVAGPVQMLDTTATTSYIVKVGSSQVARFPMRQSDVASCLSDLKAEQDAMAEFAEASPFPSPQPLFIGRPDHGYPMPWSVQTWVPGDVATPRLVESSSRVANDLAQMVIAIRCAEKRGRVFSGAGRGGDLRDHDERVAHCLAMSQSLLPVERLRGAWTALRATPRAGSDTMSHKDLTPFNILVSNDRVVGVLDTGAFGPADPALDLVVAWHLLDRDRRREFQQHVGANDLEWRRGAAWALQQALGLVWYYATTNPQMSELGHTTLERIITAPELGLQPL